MSLITDIHKLCDSLNNPVFKSKTGYGSDVDFMSRVMLDNAADIVLVRFSDQSEESRVLVRDEHGILRGRYDTDRIERLFGNTRRKIEKTIRELIAFIDDYDKAEGLDPSMVIALARSRKYRKDFKSVIKQFSRTGKVRESLKAANQVYDDLDLLLGDDLQVELLDSTELDKRAIDDYPVVVGFKNGVVLVEEGKLPRLLDKDEACQYNVTLTTRFDWFDPDKEDVGRAMRGFNFALLGPKWQKALLGAFPDEMPDNYDDLSDEDKLKVLNGKELEFLRQQLAYMWRGFPDRRMLFIWGETKTGKSTIIDGILSAFGDYASGVQEGIFTRRSNLEGPDPSKRFLVNPYRVCGGGDILEAKKLDSSMLKSITSGNDLLIFRPLHSNTYTSGPATATLIVSGNSPPYANFDDPAIKDRFVVLEKKATFTKHDPNLSVALKNDIEKCKFLHWLWIHPKGIPLIKPYVTSAMKESKDNFISESRAPVAERLANAIDITGDPEDKMSVAEPWLYCLAAFVNEKNMDYRKHPYSIESFYNTGRHYTKQHISKTISDIVGKPTDRDTEKCSYVDKHMRVWSGVKLTDEARQQVHELEDKHQSANESVF